MMKTRIIVMLIFVVMLWGSVSFVHAQTNPTFIIKNSVETVLKGDIVESEIVIQPSSYVIDTARMIVMYPSNLVEILDVRLDPFFMTSPGNYIDHEKGIINWGGFTTKGAKEDTRFVQVVYRAKQEGVFRFSVHNDSLLLEGGKNYFVEANNNVKQISILRSAGVPEKYDAPIDTIHPREPVPIFEVVGKQGNNIVIDALFGTTDEQSGVDHYEIMVDGGEFQTVQSPHRIYAPLKHVISIVLRAYDRAGNHIDHSELLNIVPENLPLIKESVDPEQETQNTDNVSWWFGISIALEIITLFVVISYVFYRRRQKT